MKKKPATPLDAAELRSQAEVKLSERKKKTAAHPATEPDPQRLVHELEVHQIELEMQNEELVQSRAQVEAGLRQYTDLYDFAPIGYFTLARDGAIHQVNLTGVNLLGIERNALIKRRFGVFVSAQSLTTFSAFLDDVFTSGSNKTCEVTLQKDGSTPLFVYIEAITKDGQREVCHVVVVDITKRKQAEIALQESEQRYRLITENMNDTVWLMDMNLRTTFISPLVERLRGYTLEELQTLPLDKQLAPASFAYTRDKLAQELTPERLADKNAKISVLLELEFYRKSGSTLWSENSFTVIRNADGQPVSILGVGRDITERKQMEVKLHEAHQKIETRTKDLEMINENLDSFAYSVSHDLRAPLRAISGFAQVLMDTQGDKVNEEMRHYLDRISEGAKKMGQLIDDLLGFSRVTRSEIKYEKINVESIVNDLVKAYREVELDRDIEFIVNPLGEVEADKEMLKVVFSNLLQNAIKFTIDRKKARIEIGSEQKEDHIQFYVKDNGIGFDMRYKDKLFKAFQRLQTDERFSGTGIGLTTVERIVSKHGGNIWANGEVDKGAEFCFTLPSKTHVED
ncbi:MAG: PAS domain S-box protein [Thermoplasmata archaeon]|nr:PAS domain S-box protein [Thermoplasmata archaeon]